MPPAFTPGPWKVRLAKGSYQRPAFIEAENIKIVAGCFGNQLEPDATSIREAEANAALIAAAPDLLNLAQANLATLEYTRRRLLEYGKPHAEIDTAINEAQATIAKATDPHRHQHQED